MALSNSFQTKDICVEKNIIFFIKFTVQIVFLFSDNNKEINVLKLLKKEATRYRFRLTSDQ